jgi:tRNA A-37 threonylcarbamoyl transferase component Bud32
MQTAMRINGYDSFEQIAVGGMAVVYKARKVSLKKTVAIKVLLPHLAADLRFITRFQQEAEAAARVQHDNIVNVIDYGKSYSSYYIVMEYYDGLTVEELLSVQGRLPVDIALSIILHVAYGLDAAHASKLVHRDIKPANLIMTRLGGIKIADFGLAKDVEKFTLVTHAGKVVGTPAYMSPEQTRGEPVGTSSDIFSLGVVAYELLAGKRPFEGGSYSEVVDRIQSFDPPAPGSMNPLVEDAIESVVGRMMTKSPAQRYPRMSDVIADLETIMRERGFRSDRRVLKDFFDDPVRYTEDANGALLTRLREKGRGGSGSRPGGVLGGIRGAFARIGRGDIPAIEENAGKESVATLEPLEQFDPALDYRVTLTAINRDMETPDSFALKLSMRLKTPAPRLRSLLSRMPCVIVRRVPYKKARWLKSVVNELGGTVTLEPLRDAPVADPAPDAAAATSGPAPATDAARYKPVTPRRTPSGAMFCPSCGWEEDADAKFCSMCHRMFNKTDKIDVRSLQQMGFEDPSENPLVEGARISRPGTLHLPVPGRVHLRELAIVAGGLLLIPVIVILLTR